MEFFAGRRKPPNSKTPKTTFTLAGQALENLRIPNVTYRPNRAHHFFFLNPLRSSQSPRPWLPTEAPPPQIPTLSPLFPFISVSSSSSSSCSYPSLGTPTTSPPSKAFSINSSSSSLSRRSSSSSSSTGSPIPRMAACRPSSPYRKKTRSTALEGHRGESGFC